MCVTLVVMWTACFSLPRATGRSPRSRLTSTSAPWSWTSQPPTWWRRHVTAPARWRPRVAGLGVRTTSSWRAGWRWRERLLTRRRALRSSTVSSRCRWCPANCWWQAAHCWPTRTPRTSRTCSHKQLGESTETGRHRHWHTYTYTGGLVGTETGTDTGTDTRTHTQAAW